MAASSATLQPIGIFDSGIGGLTVANAVYRLLPQESICYYADTARLPYGRKSADTIRKYSQEITSFLLQEQNCKAIVVACNTASAAALTELRATFPTVPIIGMEPAVKPAAEATRSGVIGVLATAGTFRSQRYAHLMQRYAQHIRICQDPCTGLVEAIEAGAPVATLLQPILKPMLAAGADTFVLGCTHYPLIREEIEQLLPPSSVIIDPAPAVARQLCRQLEGHALLYSGQEEPSYHFFTSGDESSFAAALERYCLVRS